MAESKPVVINYSPAQKYWLIAAVIAVLFTVLVTGKFWGNEISAKELAAKAALEVQVAKLEAELAEQSAELSRFSLSSKVDAAALENSRQEMIGLQREIYSRDEELRLYRELLQDSKQPSGLSVGDINLVAMEDGRIRYRWVARQKTAKMKTLSVYAAMWVLGSQDGESVKLSIAELDEQIEQLPISLDFKYFSINQGILQLPEGFIPEQVQITLRYTWMDRIQSDQKFDWILEG
jgi:hypothetical protein